MSSTHRRRVSGRNKAIGGVVAAAVVGGGAFLFTGSGTRRGSARRTPGPATGSTGYTAQYVVTNDTGQPQKDWTLEFDLPAGATLSSLWNGYVDGERPARHREARRPGTSDGIAPGASGRPSASSSNGTADRRPGRCLIDDAKCSVDDGATPEPERPPHAVRDARTPTATASRRASPPTPTATATTPTPTQSTGTGTGTTAGLRALRRHLALPGLRPGRRPPKATGVKKLQPRLRHRRRRLHPQVGRRHATSASDAVAAQIGALRAKGGDVRVSFGGASGSELATTCSSADDLAAAYGKAVDQYKLTKVDFDIEGGALPDTAANTRRAQAIAKLQQQHPGLDVSFTLPVMPEGLTQDGVNLLADAKANGVNIAAVNIMAMDYGASYSGDMGTVRDQAATATQAQVKSVLGLSDAAAWKAVAVTPMIGVNDVTPRSSRSTTPRSS